MDHHNLDIGIPRRGQYVDHAAELTEEIDVVERAAGGFEDGTPEHAAMSRVRLRLQHDRHLVRQGESIPTPVDTTAAIREHGIALDEALTARVRVAWLNFEALTDEVRRVRREEYPDAEDIADARAGRELARGMWLEARRAQMAVWDSFAELPPF